MEKVDNKLCVLIPAFNEEGCIRQTVQAIHSTLSQHYINHEILVVNDNSTDRTMSYLESLGKSINNLKILSNEYGHGFGNTVRYGLDNWQGDIIVLAMGDQSDDPYDIVKFYQTMEVKNVDCIFGNRFIKGGKAINYPFIKLCLNRIFNTLLMITVDSRYNDYTNAFKMYKRKVIESITPLKSTDFELTIEIPLKAIKNKFSFHIVPNTWQQRKVGYSKLSILKNVNSYISILLKYLSNKL